MFIFFLIKITQTFFIAYPLHGVPLRFYQGKEALGAKMQHWRPKWRSPRPLCCSFWAVVDGRKGDQTMQDTSMLTVMSSASLKLSGRFLAGNLGAPESLEPQDSAEDGGRASLHMKRAHRDLECTSGSVKAEMCPPRFPSESAVSGIQWE